MIGGSGTTGSGWIATSGVIVMADAARKSGGHLKSGEVLKVGLVLAAVPNVTVGNGNKHE
jgi:hypothetical protein